MNPWGLYSGEIRKLFPRCGFCKSQEWNTLFHWSWAYTNATWSFLVRIGPRICPVSYCAMRGARMHVEFQASRIVHFSTPVAYKKARYWRIFRNMAQNSLVRVFSAHIHTVPHYVVAHGRKYAVTRAILKICKLLLCSTLREMQCFILGLVKRRGAPPPLPLPPHIWKTWVEATPENFSVIICWKTLFLQFCGVLTLFRRSSVFLLRFEQLGLCKLEECCPIMVSTSPRAQQ